MWNSLQLAQAAHCVMQKELDASMGRNLEKLWCWRECSGAGYGVINTGWLVSIWMLIHFLSYIGLSDGTETN